MAVASDAGTTDQRTMVRRICLAALAVLVAAQLYWSWAWMRTERRPPAWDPAVHLGTGLDYREALADGRWFDLLLTRPRPGHAPYPPLYHYSLIPLLSAERPDLAVAFLNLAYLFLFSGAGAWLAWRLCGDSAPKTDPWRAWAAGGAALLALSLSPVFLAFHRQAFPDLALAAWVAAAYALMLRSEAFRRRGPALLAGLCCGLAFLSKWSAGVYLLPGLASGLADRERRKNLLAACLAAAAVSGPWYLFNIWSAAPRVLHSAMLGSSEGDPAFWTGANWLFYPRLLQRCFGPAVVLMLMGAALALRKAAAGPRPPRRVIAGWLALSYLAWSSVSNKDERYFLPAAAALPVLGFSALPTPALALAGGLTLWHARGLPAPNPEAWGYEDILKALAGRLQGEEPATLCLLANHAGLNGTSLTWLLRHRGLGERVILACLQSEIPEWSDFVLLKTGDPGPYLSDQTLLILSRAAAQKSLFHEVFREAGRWPLPDGSEAVLFEQREELPLLSRELLVPELQVKTARLEGVRVVPAGAGRYEVSVSTLRLGQLGAGIKDLRLVLDGARLLERDGRVYITRLRRIRLLGGAMNWEEISSGLSARARIPIRLGASDGKLTAEARLGPASVRLLLAVELDEKELRVGALSASVAGVPLPFARAARLRISLAPSAPYRPYHLESGPVRLLAEGPVL